MVLSRRGIPDVVGGVFMGAGGWPGEPFVSEDEVE